MTTNLRNINSFILNSYIDTVNKFVGEKIINEVDESFAEKLDKDTFNFFEKLAYKINSLQECKQGLGKVFNETNGSKNKALQEKLEIAVKALEYYAEDLNWSDCTSYGYKQHRYRKIVTPLSFFEKNGYETAQEALAKIKEIK